MVGVLAVLVGLAAACPQPHVYLSTTGSDNSMLLTESGFDTTGVWIYVVVTWDGSSMTVYSDGSVASAYVYSNFCGTYTGTLVVGQEQDAVGGSFDSGQAADMIVDTVAVYNTAWSASDVTSDKTCVDLDATDLYAVWSGEDSDDLSGNGWDAELVYESIVRGKDVTCDGTSLGSVGGSGWDFPGRCVAAATCVCVCVCDARL